MDSKKATLSDPMRFGLAATASADHTRPRHPLELSERDYDSNEFSADMEALRKSQGIHAPLRIAMERAAVSKVGHLPCITRAHGGRDRNVSLDVLTGRDESVNFQDLFGRPEDSERLCDAVDAIEHKLSKT